MGSEGESMNNGTLEGSEREKTKERLSWDNKRPENLIEE